MKKKNNYYNILNYDEKFFALKNYFEHNLSIRDLAETLNVGESTVRDWLKKIDNDFKNIERLKRPKINYENRKNPIHTDLSDEIKEMILALIKNHPNMGALKIKQYFFRHHQMIISEKKVYFFLKKNGIISARKKRNTESKNSGHNRRFEFPAPLLAVQVDLLQITLSGNHKCYLVSFLDDYSRFILLSEIIPVKSMVDVIRLCKKVVKQYGVFEHLICDKGSEFVSWQSFTEFEELLCALDIELIASGPETPQNQGKIERWHKTFREDCESVCGGFTLQSEAQYKITEFVNFYNFERPHQALGGLVPADRFYGISNEIEEELSTYAEGKRPNECIYISCNINGKKLVVSGDRNKELTIYDNPKE